ncbi:RNA-guided endonuclease InsQ/TnpB family protein [Kitasatospora kifunensis]|uniref:Putative transposase n=1 Tax=Kitasatospora kifunensis TaxID=58351 RepID=A0A7W7VUK5_KITKI|nr:RNA-guided endonuclease TnpB family protein [Kitasatospora kifunensis]MBB4923431.1 putative transposase [Kitasatospora kifunensis]
MKRQRGHKALLELTAEQVIALDEQGHAARAMWNLLHDWWTMAGKCPLRRASLALADQHIRQARKEIPWLATLPAQAAQQVLKQYHRAWINCWEGRAGAPNFKSRIRSRMSVDVPQGRDLQIRRISRRWGQCRVPKLGLVRFRWTKDLPGATRNGPAGRVTGARLVKEAYGWHIVFRTETLMDDVQPKSTGRIVGIDRGITVPLALSDGTDRDHGPWLTAGERKRLVRLERKAARQHRSRKPGQPTSRRLTTTYDQIARYRATAKRRAADWQHKTTTELADTFIAIGIEDLAITNMVKSAKGTVENPGTRVRQKAGLNRAIAGEAWGRTVELLAYKLTDRGGHLIKVPAAGTSQRCSACGIITPGNRETQARFACKARGCGYTANADTNAARNIEHAAGRAVSGRGAFHCEGREASTTNDVHPRDVEISRLQPEEEVNPGCPPGSGLPSH